MGDRKDSDMTKVLSIDDGSCIRMLNKNKNSVLIDKASLRSVESFVQLKVESFVQLKVESFVQLKVESFVQLKVESYDAEQAIECRIN